MTAPSNNLSDHDTSTPTQVADDVVASLAPTADYTQVFVESTREVRRELIDGDHRATLVEVRQGVGCLILKDGSWRYRHFMAQQLPELGQWLPGVSALPARLGLADRSILAPCAPTRGAPGGDRTDKLLEDHVVRTFAVADTTGVRETVRAETVRRRAEVTVRRDGMAFRGFSRWFGTAEATSRAEASADSLIGRAVTSASAAARARHWGRQRTDVVFGPSAGAGFLHELIGHALEEDNTARQSPYIRALFRPGALPESLVLMDDPGIRDGYGSYGRDDEGQVARPRVMAAAGSAHVISSVRSSWLNDRHRPGNGRRQDYRHFALPRASNTVVAAGCDDDSRILTPSIRGTLVVGGLGAGEINLATGEFVFAALDSHVLTRDGTPEPVSDAVLVGNAAAVLRRLEAVGQHVGGDNATCGKQGQFLGIGLYSPLMRFADLEWTAA
ncbi:metallopeptidase TldD-related protein [Streptomyces bacillaris]|uniref:metallopeptidase TldD-related protein n=1 Tax=Streptomyces bacillaris TaxID=68179 RepID=UPI003344597A